MRRCCRAERDRGAILILALVYVVAVSLVVLALASWASNDLNNTAKFVKQTQLEASARNTAEFAINSIRYTPLLGANQTLNNLSNCWGTSSPSTQTYNFQNGASTNQTSYTFAAWCQTTWTPLASTSRTVDVDVCLSTISASACENSPYLFVQVIFDDYPNGSQSAPIQSICTVWCGQGINIVQWVWQPAFNAQSANSITITSTAPSNATVGGNAYIPAATDSYGGSPIITSSTPSTCSITNGVVEFLGVGGCQLVFTDSGNQSYAPASPLTQSFSIGAGVQGAISLTTTTSTYGSSLTLGATGGSGTGAFSYTAVNGTATGCSVSGGVLTSASSGTCTVTVTKAASGSYGVASATSTVVFGQEPLTIQPNPLSESVVQGKTPGALTPTYVGLVAGDTATNVPATCTTTANTASLAGTYISSCSGASDPDYLISYINGTVTVDGAVNTPTAPTNMKAVLDPAATRTSTLFDLSWTAPSNFGGATAVTYTILYQAYGATSFTPLVTGVTSTSYTTTAAQATANFPVGKDYSFEVEAVNSAGASLPSSSEHAGYPALVRQSQPTNYASATSYTIDNGANPSNYDDLVLMIGDTSGVGVSTVTQTGCAAWSQVALENPSFSTQGDVEIWVAPNESNCTNSKVTVTMASATTLQVAALSEWSGLNFTTPVTGTAPGNYNFFGISTLSTVGLLGSFNTRANFDLILGAGIWANSTPGEAGISSPTGATELTPPKTPGPAGPYQGVSAYYVDPGTTNQGISFSNTSGVGWGVAVALAAN